MGRTGPKNRRLPLAGPATPRIDSPDSSTSSRSGDCGDDAGPGPGVDRAARLRGLRDDRAAAPAGAGHRGSMTPSARRMASLAGSSCCYGEADKLLEELANVNSGAKRIEAHDAPGGGRLRGRRRPRLHRRRRRVATAAVRRVVPERVVDHRLQRRRGQRPCLGVLVGGGRRPLRPGPDLAKRWARRLCRLLKEGHADKVLAALGKAGGGECDKAARLHRRAPRPHDALRRLPGARLAHRLGPRRGGLQDRRRTALCGRGPVAALLDADQMDTAHLEAVEAGTVEALSGDHVGERNN